MDERRPSLQSVVNAAVDAGLHNLYTMAPAKVTKWEADKQRATVQILVKNVTTGEEDNREVASWPAIPGVPVQFVEAGGFRITCPVSDGNLTIDGSKVPATIGSLIFSFRSLSKFLSGNGSEVDPEFDHSHALTDAVFFPGLHTFGNPLGSCPTDHMTIGHDAGQQIHFEKGVITIGDTSGAQKTLLAETLLSDMKSQQTTINSILQGGTAGSPVKQMIVLAAQFATTTLYTNLQSGGDAYLSTKVKNK